MGIVKKPHQSDQDGTTPDSPAASLLSGHGPSELRGHFHILRRELQPDHQPSVPLHHREEVRGQKQEAVHQHANHSVQHSSLYRLQDIPTIEEYRNDDTKTET